MICGSCVRGVHCGPPGVPGPCGTCQHHPRGSAQDATDTVTAPPEDVGGTDPQPEAPRPSVPSLVAILTAWHSHHSRGRFAHARVLRRIFADKTITSRLPRGEITP